MPEGLTPFVGPGGGRMTWKKWIFWECHVRPTYSHRSVAKTVAVMKRTAWWPGIGTDATTWALKCSCAPLRARPLPPVLRSLELDEASRDICPWEDCYIDVSGPFTESVDGYRYILTYFCRLLRVPKLGLLKNLRKGHFLRRS